MDAPLPRCDADLRVMTRLYDVANLCARVGGEPQRCFGELLEAAIDLVGADRAVLQVLDPASGRLEAVARRGLDTGPDALIDADALAPPEAVAPALENGERVVVAALSALVADDRVAALRQAGVEAALWMPLASGGGRPLGRLVLFHHRPHAATPAQLRIVDLLARQAADYLERRQVEQAAQLSEERLRVFTGAVSAMVYRLNDDWSRMSVLQGREFVAVPTGPTGDWIDQYIAAVDRPRMREAIRDAVARRGTFVLEHRALQSDGSVGWRHSCAVPLLDPEGRILEWFGTATDITRRKRSEEALQASEARYRTLFESIDVGYCIIRVLFDAGDRPVDYVFEEVNPAFERHTGIADAAGKSMRQISPDTEGHWYETYGRVARTGEPTRFEQPALALGRWFDVYAYPIGDPAEHRVAILFQDVMDRKQAANAVQASEQRLRTIIGQLPAGVGVMDRSGRWTLTNAVMDRYVPGDPAAPRARAPGRWASWDDAGQAIPPDQWPVARALRGETVMPGMEMQHTDEDGVVRWIRTSAAPLTVQDGEVTEACAVLLDITKIKTIEEMLRQGDRHKDEFLATLAHELRNPLAPIRTGLDILRLARGTPGTTEQVVQMLQRQVAHMVRLVDDLMEVSRISRGKIEVRKQRVDVTSVMSNAVETSRPLIDRAHHRLAIELPGDPLVVDGDPVRLAQVISNLLNNAAKYTEDGGQIRLSAHRDGDEAVVRVRDNGMGIPRAMLPRVFDWFSQAERTFHRSQGGLGIGLTLVRTLVEMHGGSVSAASEGAGQGSEFTVRLPLVPDTDPHDARPRDGADAQARLSSRILIVDDNRDAARSLCLLLEFLGAEVRTMHDGASALAVLDEFDPEVALLDLGMPGMNGCELARQIRRRQGGDRCTLIALTGWGQDEDRRQTREAGFDHHVVKPVDVAALEGLLHVDRSHRRQR